MSYESESAWWIPQSAERVDAIGRRGRDLVVILVEEHFRRMILEWAGRDDGPMPTRKEAYEVAMNEVEIVCRGLGRLAALPPAEIFPPAARDTTGEIG